ncbi:hypothetical protein J6590_099508 [Homalodisca vitripennis]|nr:hypothetical protein J6590_099508 [Homalodisca vitripennis]
MSFNRKIDRAHRAVDLATRSEECDDLSILPSLFDGLVTKPSEFRYPRDIFLTNQPWEWSGYQLCVEIREYKSSQGCSLKISCFILPCYCSCPVYILLGYPWPSVTAALFINTFDLVLYRLYPLFCLTRSSKMSGGRGVRYRMYYRRRTAIVILARPRPGIRPHQIRPTIIRNQRADGRSALQEQRNHSVRGERWVDASPQLTTRLAYARARTCTLRVSHGMTTFLGELLLRVARPL